MAEVNENVEDTIRRCVREEMLNFRGERTPARLGTENLLNRTRSLIQSAASSAARELPRERPKRSFNSAPGHPFRPLKKKKGDSRALGNPIPKSVHLLEKAAPDDDNDDGEGDYSGQGTLSYRENMVVLKGEFDLTPGHSEDEVRSELVEVFKTKFKLITKFDFDFVKRERSSVIVPAVKPGHKWDFAHIKNLCGQGRLYTQLNVSSDELVEREGELNDEINLNPEPSITIDDGPSSSYLDIPVFEVQPVKPSQVEVLQQVFPRMSASDARDAISQFGSADAAADALSQSGSSKETENRNGKVTINEKPKNSSEILLELKSQMKGPCEKLTVDKEDLVSDALYHYKSRDFDATTPLRIRIRNQVAVDNGGVLRQFYSDVFASLARSDEMKLFQGEVRRRLPLFKNEHVITGIFEILGKMIAHSLVQEGPGFPYLAPVIYSYISSGDLQVALLKVSIMDVCDPILAGVIQKVRAYMSHEYLLYTGTCRIAFILPLPK